jgi:limonene-1,2-epoxide hydrolase
LVVSGTPTAEVEVVRSFLKALEAKDLDSALTYLSPDVAYQNMPIPAVRGPRNVGRLLRPCLRVTGGVEVRINHVAASGAVVLTERTDSLLIGPVRIPFPVCGTFKVNDGRIDLWRDTLDWTTIFVNTLLAGPLYLFRRTAMSIAMRAAARK